MEMRTKVPGWYWAVAVLALLWGLIAVVGFVASLQMTPADVAKLPAVEAETWRAMPGWLWALYGMATLTCLAGALALLVRRRWAIGLFVVSLAAAVAQFSYTLATTRLIAVEGWTHAAGLPLFIWVAGAALIWFSRMAARRGWIG